MFKRLASISILQVCLLLAASPARAQSTPVFTEYKGVKIGMAADEVRKTLEDYLKAKGDRQDVLVIANSESAQVFYDDKGKVTAVSIDYTDGNTQAPTAMQVLGREVEARADGSMYALERYPEAGYWVSYNRTSGAHPIVTITMQAL